jgi:hypothetical protein
MRRDVAVALMQAINAATPHVDRVFDLTKEIEDSDERLVLRKRLSEVIHILGYDLVMHIVRQYPDLDPDK